MKKLKNIKHVWSIMCESSIVDRDSNNISIHKVLEQLNISLSPENEVQRKKNGINKPFGVTFPFQIVSLWQSINPKITPVADAEIELFDSIGQSLQTVKFTFTFEKDKPRLRTIISSPVINVIDSGVYLFKIKIKESGESNFSEVAEIPLEVRVNKKT